MTNIDPENTEQMLAYKTTIKMYEMFSFLFGSPVTYHWNKQNFMFWFTNVLLAFTWSLILYTMWFHCSNGNVKRIAEPLAIGGISIAASGKKNEKFEKNFKLKFSF